jgi:tRNA G18 (ribose-2'-O)-methylase SpoU
MIPKTITQPNFASSPHLNAVRSGQDFFNSLKEFNVIDEYKGLSVDEIKNKLTNSAFPYAVCMENWTGNINFATGIRNANAFNAKEIFYVGAKRFDKRGAVGTINYKDVRFLSSLEELKALKSSYRFIGIDNVPGSVAITGYKWFKDNELPPLLIFGEEACGLTEEIKSHCEDIVFIPQFGSVRSLNVGTASGIIFHSVVSELHK